MHCYALLLSIVGAYNNWLNLTAGAVRFFEFYNPNQVFWLFKVCTLQPATG
jgi:hypothetical protein